MTETFELEYQNYTELAFHRRGVIINQTIMLERIIDDIIANYFCGQTKKKIELLELIISTNRMIFENKIQVLKFILKNNNIAFLTENEKAFSEILNLIIPERNIFAHYWLETSKKLSTYIKEQKTVFIKFKDTTDFVEYDEIKFINIVNIITKNIHIFGKLQAAVWK